MNLTRASCKNPAATVVVVILILLFGLLAMAKLPVQLLPDLDRPQIFINNGWRAAAPQEMEATIIEPQENTLRNVPGVVEIQSNVGPGFGSIALTFEVGQDMQRAMLDVINALNQAPPRPREAAEPVINVGSGRGNVASILIKQMAPDAPDDFSPYLKLIRDNVGPRLRAISGVSNVELASDLPKELHITFDPYKMAALGISIEQIQQSINRSSNVSGGFAEVGRRQYTVRFEGQFDAQSYGRMIISYNQGRPVYLAEIAQVEVGYPEVPGFTKRNGLPAYYLTLERGENSNTVAILDEVNKAITELNRDVLAAKGLEMELSFDASVHIRRAIALVNSNLWLGVALSLLILFAFLRGVKATLLIGLSIPVCLLVAFIMLQAFGRSLNVVSLAGLAFAVGMVLDAAIIVQENIVRLQQQGMGLLLAIKKGTAQVKGALFASTVTTVAIFLPVLFMQGVEGQLFYDLALTLAVAVSASMLVALTVIPVASMLWFKQLDAKPDPLLPLWHWLSDKVTLCTGSLKKALGWTLLLVPGSLLLIYLLLPKADFLPQANSDGIFTGFTLPPGGNIKVLEQEIGQLLVQRLKPYYQDKKYPAIKGYNMSMFPAFNVLFIYPEDPRAVDDMLTLLRTEILKDLPDTTSFSFRASLLNFGFNSGRELYLDFQGPDSELLMQQAAAAMALVQDKIPGANVQAQPGLAQNQPELKILPDEMNIAKAGVDRFTVANAVRAMTDGIYVGEQFDGNERMDIILRAIPWTSPEQLQAMPLYTSQAGVQTIGQLTSLQRTVGPTNLLRVNGLRTVSLQISPPADMALSDVMAILQQDIVLPLRQQLGDDLTIGFRGSADRLEAAISTMALNFTIAVFILFLLMAALFKSVKASLLVVLTMPMSLLGGVVALKLLNVFTFQALDLLTMIGFIILLGLVVNNAILLVEQYRDSQATGLNPAQAIREAVQVRARPIYMSTLTSIFGMLPLMLVPGVGSEIYRGLATVIVGGMTFSAIFTLILMPALLYLSSWQRSTTPIAETGAMQHVCE
ncbi:MAG TPA: acriflavine resistance protein B [Rheinheimera sp.]|uniref:efflux RND transporter permease subunit n=1 Tax=Rheinheimera sp. TaxID=1869214 RepID=UPI000EC51D18|nr:efflux RND transporter permease subunit [Rheinheimera sp.]HCU67408.1 acriflavine resistance protein B [Rheinheimera sp.]